MKAEGIMLSKISQKEKDKHHVISLICEIWKQTNQTEAPELTDTENRLVVARGSGGGLAKWMNGVERDKLPAVT